MRPRALLVLALVAGPATANAQLPPHTSWSTLVWGNGRTAGAYDTSQSKMVSFKEHLFDHTQAGASRELLYDQYPGLRVAGQNIWLTDRPVDTAGYDANRGIAHVQQTWNGVQVATYLWSPFDSDAPLTVIEYEVTNTTSAALTDASLFAIDNVHVGSGDGTIGEHITWTSNAFEERGAAGLVLHQPSPAPAIYAASPNNPFASVNAGGHLVSTTDSGVMDDAVCGFEWDLTGLAPGATQHFSIVIADRSDGDRASLDAQLAMIPSDPAAALAAARAEWDAFFARAKVPPGASADETAVYREQLAVLRMGQVRADGPGSGQIIASMPTGPWDIAWVRDQTYATQALVQAGLTDEAKAALTYWWTTTTNNYVCCDTTGAPWVGAPYAPSVVRYTGDGVEESDSDGNGPNVEFDGFGLALAATDAYVTATGDTAVRDRELHRRSSARPPTCSPASSRRAARRRGSCARTRRSGKSTGTTAVASTSRTRKPRPCGGCAPPRISRRSSATPPMRRATRRPRARSPRRSRASSSKPADTCAATTSSPKADSTTRPRSRRSTWT